MTRTSTRRRAALGGLVLAGMTTASCSVTGGTASAEQKAESPRNTAAVRGVYRNPEGNASIEFMAGGGAHFSFHGVGGSCTFTQKTRAVVLTCEGEDTTFTVEGDGALTGPKNSFLTRMTKTAL